MDTDHNKANDDLRSMASSHGFPFKPALGRAQSAPVRDYAAKYLPMLQQHLTLARQVAGQVGADTALAHHARKAAAKRK
jgi:hypothetical protein